MGIYTNDTIYGIRIYNFDDDEFCNILFETKFDKIMSHEQMREAYLAYMLLDDKTNLFFKFYTECMSTLNKYNNDTFMDWYPMTLNTFLDNFEIRNLQLENTKMENDQKSINIS